MEGVTMARLALAVLGAALVAACSSSLEPVAVQSGSPRPTQSAGPTTSAGTESASPTPTPYSAPSNAPTPIPLSSSAAAEPDPTPTPGPTVPPGTTPFPTPGATITPGSTRVIGTIRRVDGSPAAGICVVLEKGICPIATDAKGSWFTDIPAGPLNWNFIYRVEGTDVGRQFVLGTQPGELRLPIYTLSQ
jgi:hypothetical protein